MKIALISHLYPTEITPAHGSFIHEQAVELRNHARVDVFVPTVRAVPFTARYRQNHAPLLDEQGKRVRYVSFPRKRLPGIIRKNLTGRLVPLIVRGGYDIVHVNWAFPDAMVIPALKKKGISTLLHIHGSDWYKSRKPPNLLKLVEESFHSAGRILVVGGRLREEIASAYPQLRSKIFVHHNPVDTGLFSLPEDKTAAKLQIKWDPERKHALTVANLRQEKGIDILIDAIRHSLLSGTHFHILGNAFSDDYQRRIESMISDHSLPVTIHPPVSHHELKKYFHAADLFVLPSRKEGFGLALAEAASTGLPLVSTKSGGPEDIINSTNGLLATPESSEDLAKAIVYMLENLQKYDPETIRRDIAVRFDKELMMKKLLDHYNHVMQ